MGAEVGRMMESGARVGVGSCVAVGVSGVGESVIVTVVGELTTADVDVSFWMGTNGS